jgi:glutathionylspermidine synthase
MSSTLGSIDLQTFDLPPNHSTIEWLTPSPKNPAVELFQQKYGKQMCDDPEKKTSFFYTISSSTHAALRKATTELHAMFVHATEHVCENPRYWKSFGFPDYFWKRAIHSFYQGGRLLMGRFDFSITPEKGIRCYEYNADSASGLFEGGHTQGAWAVAAGLGNVGVDGGIGLSESMVKAWQSFLPEGTLVHFLFDSDAEETYHATYVMSLATKAGLVCSAACGKSLDGFSFDEDGHVLDEQKRPVRHVWKTWSYATLLSLWDGSPLNTSGLVRLIDVCLNEDIEVLEPFWSAIPASKAILPVLCELYKDHPNLLFSTFTLTDRLKQEGYVSKPVMGRCGENVSLHLPGASEAAAHTEGKFSSSESVYQELCSLPKLNGSHVQCNAFVVASHYAGTLVRIADEPILGYTSECVIIRVIDDGINPVPTSAEVAGPSGKRKIKRAEFEGETKKVEVAKKPRRIQAARKAPLPLGTVLGVTLGGVAAYCSLYDVVDTSVYVTFKHQVGELYYGFRYQCVEFCRRFLIHTQGLTFGDLQHAYELFDLPRATWVHGKADVPWDNVENGSATRPLPGSIIVWAQDGEFVASGHVGVVVEVSDNWVRIAEQNVDETPWGKNWARELPVRPGSGFYVDDPRGRVRGWKNLTADFQPSPVAIVLDEPEVAAMRRFESK